MKNAKTLIIFAIIIFCLAVFLIGRQLPYPTGKSIINKEINKDAEPKNEVFIMNDVVVLETNKGNIEIEINRQKAPLTAENFIRYVNEGFYDSTIFHRIIDGFMIQAGGFSTDGELKETHSLIKLETTGLKNEVGTVAMARKTEPDSATSQFFINVVDNAFLDSSTGNPGYAVFGKVISGMDVVNEIKKVGTTTRGGQRDWPMENIVIQRAYVKK